MWPLLIVLADPQIEIGLQLVERTIHLFAFMLSSPVNLMHVPRIA
jgi:hypothetical protein